MRRLLKGFAWTTILLIGASVVPWLDSSAARTPKKVAPRPLQVRYDGTLELEGDYHRPGETRLHYSEQRFYREPGGRVRLDWTTWTGTDTARVPETYLVSGDSVFHRDAPSARWTLLMGRSAHEGCLQSLAGFPAELERVTRRRMTGWHAELVGKAGRPEGRRRRTASVPHGAPPARLAMADDGAARIVVQSGAGGVAVSLAERVRLHAHASRYPRR